MINPSTTDTRSAALAIAIKVSAALLALALFSSAAFAQNSSNAPGQPPSFAPQVEVQQQDYAKARKHFQTKLLRRGPSPQEWGPLAPPKDVTEVTYPSGSLRLKAWVSQPRAGDNRKQPAVLFLHGGHAFEMGDWQMSQPFRDAGFVVMTPLLRGENGQAGDFSMFYNEVDDVIAAAEYLRHQSYVKSAEIFVAGHSVGGTMAMLAAMTYKHFRGAASFSGSPDQVIFVKYAPNGKEQAVFDTDNAKEFEMRSPLAYAASFKCPVRLYYGVEETHFDLTSKKTAEIARTHKIAAQAVQVKGGHMSEVPSAESLAIEFFRQTAAR